MSFLRPIDETIVVAPPRWRAEDEARLAEACLVAIRAWEGGHFEKFRDRQLSDLACHDRVAREITDLIGDPEIEARLVETTLGPEIRVGFLWSWR